MPSFDLGAKGASTEPSSKTIDNGETRSKELHRQMKTIFAKFAGDEGHVFTRDLPSMLQEFERQRGFPLMEENCSVELHGFASGNPDVPLPFDVLINLIVSLEGASKSKSLPKPHEPVAADSVLFCDDVPTRPQPESQNDPPPVLKSLSRQSSMESVFEGYGQESPILFARPRAPGRRKATRSSPSSPTHDNKPSSPMPRSVSAEVEWSASSEFDFSSTRSSPMTSFTEEKEDEQPIISRKQTSSPTVEEMQRLVAEKDRKLAAVQESFDEQVFELQSRLEDMRSQMMSLKKEDKERRQQQKTLVRQNTDLESETGRLQKQVENQKSLNNKLKKDYDMQCEIAERTRELLGKKSNELETLVRDFKQLSAHAYECENGKLEAEAKVAQLRVELQNAQETDAELVATRQENTMLKETVDRLQLDIEEAKQSTNGFFEVPSRNSSLPGTYTRSLSAELAATIASEQYKAAENEQETNTFAPKPEDEFQHELESLSSDDEQDEKAHSTVRPFHAKDARMVVIVMCCFIGGVFAGYFSAPEKHFVHYRGQTMDLKAFRDANTLPVDVLSPQGWPMDFGYATFKGQYIPAFQPS